MAGKPDSIAMGSGDVFVDLGFAGAAERKLRVQIAMRLNALIDEHGLTQARAHGMLSVA